MNNNVLPKEICIHLVSKTPLIMKNKLSFCTLLVAAALFAFTTAHAQYYSVSWLGNPGNPGGINTDPDFNATQTIPAGATTILGPDIPVAAYSAVQTIPFTFNFNGSPVTQYLAASSGYITFTTSSVTPADTVNAALPSA